MYPSKTQAVATAIYGFDSAKIGILFQTTNNFAVKKTPSAASTYNILGKKQQT